MSLRWVKSELGSMLVYNAYSGDLMVGHVVRLTTPPHRFVWHIDAVFMKYIGTGRGECVSRNSAMRSLEKNWNVWKEHAGLTMMETCSQE